MTDETPEERAAAGQPPPAGPDDPDAALRRLESLGSPGTSPAQPGPAPLPRAPVVDPFMEPPPARPPRPVSGAKRAPRARPPRPAGGSRSSRMAARIAAPVVFLVAVIALVGIVVDSGVMDEPAPTPTVKATKTKAGGTGATRKYVVQEGDSLSSIAVRFKTTTAQLKVLNPNLSGSTVVIGQRIVVPAQ